MQIKALYSIVLYCAVAEVHFAFCSKYAEVFGYPDHLGFVFRVSVLNSGR